MKLFTKLFIIIILLLLIGCNVQTTQTIDKNPPVNIEDLNGWYCVESRYSFAVHFTGQYYFVNGYDLVNNFQPPCGQWQNPFPYETGHAEYDSMTGKLHFPGFSDIVIEVIDNRTMVIKNNGSFNGTAKRVQEKY